MKAKSNAVPRSSWNTVFILTAFKALRDSCRSQDSRGVLTIMCVRDILGPSALTSTCASSADRHRDGTAHDGMLLLLQLIPQAPQDRAPSPHTFD
uniref:Uncharacterized protein n=1 Tax=Knipowitschia caucasica TaxID=637954 RepID=A0AAV2KVS7_KNICA